MPVLFSSIVAIALLLVIVLAIINSFSPPPIKEAVEGEIIETERRITEGWFNTCTTLKIKTTNGSIFFGYVNGEREEEFKNKKITASFGWRHKSDDAKTYHILKEIRILA